jgi:hypothetical protein
MNPSDVVSVELTDDERLLLVSGLIEWGGPARGAAVIAPLVGAASVDDFFQLTGHLENAIRSRQPLSNLDWARALALTEICWASDLLGAASEFGPNMSDERALAALRSLQRKLVTGERIRLLIDNALAIDE